MATVEITEETFTSRSAPPVCVFTGVPAEEVFAFSFRNTDGSKTTGALPVEKAAVATLAKLRRLILGLAVAAVIALFVGVVMPSTTAAITALGLMAIATAGAFVSRKRLVGGFVSEGRVFLNNVHPAFAEAVSSPTAFGKCSTCPTLADCPNRQTS